VRLASPLLAILSSERSLGDVFELRVFSQPMIVLNSLAAAKDLVDKRGSIYSDRPRFVLFSELYPFFSPLTGI